MAQALDSRIGLALMGTYGCIHWPNERDGLDDSILLQIAFTPAFSFETKCLAFKSVSVGCRDVLACWYSLNNIFLCHPFGSLLRLSV